MNLPAFYTVVTVYRVEKYWRGHSAARRHPVFFEPNTTWKNRIIKRYYFIFITIYYYLYFHYFAYVEK
jgi:hypothetical protein